MIVVYSKSIVFGTTWTLTSTDSTTTVLSKQHLIIIINCDAVLRPVVRRPLLDVTARLAQVNVIVSPLLPFPELGERLFYLTTATALQTHSPSTVSYSM